jgi:two-component system, chemotaxis family, chemotaxis protein CheY
MKPGETMKKILIIDDSDFMRMAVKKIFPTGQYQFVESRGGKEAIELCTSEKPDLVLLDIVMPKIRGLDILKQLKEQDPDIKVIMISAVGRESMIEECQKLGIVDYIKKPFDDEHVKTVVKRCFGS